MKTSKDNIITEKYHAMFWTREKCANAIAKTIKKFFTKSEIGNELDGQILSKKLFSWKKMINKKHLDLEKDQIEDGGNFGFVIRLSFIYEFQGKELKKFVFGDKKLPGLIWNSNLTENFNKIGFEKNQNPIAKEDIEYSLSDLYLNQYKNLFLEDESSISKMPDSLKIKFVFLFDKFTLTDKLDATQKNRTKNKFNPNYISQCKGAIGLVLGNEIIKIGEVTYWPKRSKDMEPKESLSSKFAKSFADAWNKAPTDRITPGYDITNVVAKQVTDTVGNLFTGNATIQKESFQIDISQNFRAENLTLNDNKTESKILIADNEKYNDKEDIEKIINQNIESLGYRWNIDIISQGDSNSEYYTLTLQTADGKHSFFTIEATSY